MDNNLRIALLIDGDNVSPKYVPAIMAEMQRRGTCAIKRIYGDWTTPNMNGWKRYLQQYCIRPIQQFRHGENATDGAIIMDAMEILFTHERIESFCIVSSDSDFYSVCLKIRETGRTVIGIGEHKTKELLQRACNEFVFLENLVPSEAAEPPDDTYTDSDPETLLRRAYQEAVDDGEWVAFSHLGHVAKGINSSFDPRTYNHSNFRSLIESLDCFEVQPDKRIPPNYYCRLKPTAQPVSADRRTGKIKNFRNWFGFIQCDDGDYYFTRSNVRKDQQRLKLRPGAAVAFDTLRRPDPAASESAERNGKAGNVELVETRDG